MTTQATTPAITTNETPEATTFPAQLIDKANDISAFASDEPSRCVIQGIHLDRRFTEATDGKIMIRVPYVTTPATEYPAIDRVSDELTDSIVNVKAFTDAIKAAPKSKNLPVLQTVRLSSNAKGDKVQLATTDLDDARVVESKRIEGKYPNTDAVWPEQPDGKSICLSGELLKRIADYAIKHGKDDAPIRLTMTDEFSPVTFAIKLEDGREAKGVLMPMRMS